MTMSVVKLSFTLATLSLAACAFGMSLEEYAELPLCSRLGAWASTCGTCLAGDGAACMQVSEAYTHGRDARIGERTAELFAARACQAGDSEGCVVVGKTLARDEAAFAYRDGLKRRFGEVCEIAAETCERGHQGQCLVAAECLIDSDRKQARALLAGLCVDGSARACTLAGDHADRPSTAALMYARGCELGASEACIGVAASQQLGLGLPVDADHARQKFTYECGESATFAACHAVAGYLPVTWLGRARLASGLGTTGLPAPDAGRLADLSYELMELDRTAVAGFCLGDDGRAADVKMLQTWGDARVDAAVVDAVRQASFGAQTGVEHRCWWMTYRIKYRR